MAIVANCILSSLAKSERLEHLKDFFSQDVKTPPSVMEELEEAIRGFNFVKAIKGIRTFSSASLSPERWLLVAPLTEGEEELSAAIMAEAGLAKPAADCIALAERRREILLTDDAYAGKVAQERKDGKGGPWGYKRPRGPCLFSYPLFAILRMGWRRDGSNGAPAGVSCWATSLAPAPRARWGS